MNYYICEGSLDREYNATSKARKDVEYILNKMNIKKYFIPTRYGVQKNKLFKFKQLMDYYKNYKIWNKSILKLKSKDVLFIQYPLTNTILNFEKVIKQCKEIGIITVIIIHDLDSLRTSNMPRVEKEDKNVLNNASYIIAHNSSMKKKLIEMENSSEKIIELELFDYITECDIEFKERRKVEPIIIAGNLSKEKAEYLKYLKDINNIKFNLYGKGYKKETDEKNVNYKGAFLPEELLNNLEGGFGLVWDGISKESCLGIYGKYLKYNNPHKTSMYITAGIPVIVWEKSAIAELVLKNNVGFTIKKLDDINDEIIKISDTEYLKMLNNTKEMSLKMRKGYFLNNAVKKVLEKIGRK